jgi:hypothetical protein
MIGRGIIYTPASRASVKGTMLTKKVALEQKSLYQKFTLNIAILDVFVRTNVNKDVGIINLPTY